MASDDDTVSSVSSYATLSEAPTMDTNPFRQQSTNPFNRDVVDAIFSLRDVLSQEKVKDIRHIENFTGDGERITVVIKLNQFLYDFSEYFANRNISNNDKCLIVKQKLSGSAKVLINSLRPDSLSSLTDSLINSFGIDQISYDTIINQLKSTNVRTNESFQQFYIRLKDIANLLTIKLNTHFSNVCIFEPFSKSILAKFPAFISVQSDVLRACKNLNIDALYFTLSNILLVNPSLWNQNKNEVNNKPNKSQNPSHSVVRNSHVTCANCWNPGHVVKECNALKHNNQFFRFFK